MRAGTSAAICIVPELVHMDAPFRWRIIACDVVGDGGRGGFRGLLKGDCATDGGVATENCDFWWRRESVSQVVEDGGFLEWGWKERNEAGREVETKRREEKRE